MYNKNGMKIRIKSVLLILSILFSVSASAQHRSKLYEKYIENHKDLAISHMKKYKIPASITLAQGLLESGAGMSRLATKANNHFGIKCHKDWTGDSMPFTDDAPNECFRKYKTVEESYTDHSLFLTRRGRYSSLFDLEITDYKGWAKGLQLAGYATDKGYANKLIKLIEDYELYLYDDKKYASSDNKKTEERKPDKKDREFTYPIYKTPSGLLYIEAKGNDNFSAIAAELGFKVKDLIKYNEVPNVNYPLLKGDIVYLEKKKKKADIPFYYHIVIPGESMHSISQFYGIRLKNLYKMNKKDGNYVPEEGDQLKLR